MDSDLSTLHNLVNQGVAFIVAYGFQILGALIILAVGFLTARWVGRLITGLCSRHSLDATLSKFFANIARLLVLAFVVIIAMGKFGITIAPFIAAIGAIAFGSSLAIQGPLSNYGAGLTIILTRPFVIGNTITVKGVSGVVEEIRLGNTELRTEDGETILIPNKHIVGEILLNSYANRVVETAIGIEYNADPAAAVGVILGTLRAINSVVDEPPPQVGIAAFGDSAIEIGIRYWVPTVEYFQVQYAANAALHAALRDADIRIAPRRQHIRIVNQGDAGA